MNRQLLITAVLMLALGAGGGYWLANRQQSHEQPGRVGNANLPTILFYRNPMNPSVTSPVPAKDAMGMDYEKSCIVSMNHVTPWEKMQDLRSMPRMGQQLLMQVPLKSMPLPCKTWACGLQLPKRPCFRMWCEP